MFGGYARRLRSQSGWLGTATEVQYKQVRQLNEFLPGTRFIYFRVGHTHTRFGPWGTPGHPCFGPRSGRKLGPTHDDLISTCTFSSSTFVISGCRAVSICSRAERGAKISCCGTFLGWWDTFVSTFHLGTLLGEESLRLPRSFGALVTLVHFQELVQY